MCNIGVTACFLPQVRLLCFILNTLIWTPLQWVRFRLPCCSDVILEVVQTSAMEAGKTYSVESKKRTRAFVLGKQGNGGITGSWVWVRTLHRGRAYWQREGVRVLSLSIFYWVNLFLLGLAITWTRSIEWVNKSIEGYNARLCHSWYFQCWVPGLWLFARGFAPGNTYFAAINSQQTSGQTWPLWHQMESSLVEGHSQK